VAAIVWLASYPKSGNTWVRILLANYLLAGEGPVDINDLSQHAAMAGSRALFDGWVGVEASALDRATIDRLRPAVYRRMAEEADETLYVKVHDAWGRDDRGLPMFPPDVTGGAVYIVRNPLDVAVSCMHHWNVDAEEAVARMCDPAADMSQTGPRLAEQVAQQLGSWSSHARSWLDESGLPCHVVRYEDLRLDPGATFAGLVRACGLPDDAERLRRAVEFSDFAGLQVQEREHGFHERPPTSRGGFFRRGEVGSWRSELPAGPAAHLAESERAMMARFGYDAAGG
jgi:aryl sulfotransferase